MVPPKKNSKLVGIQVARAVAAVVVVLAHAIAHPSPHAQGFSHVMGRGGVTLFFVISGFIMARVTGPGQFDPGHFISRRLLRVAPPYYAATLLAAFAALIIPWAFKDTPFDLGHIVYSLLFIPVFAPGSATDISPFFKLGWTLNYEMFFYLIFALCCTLSERVRASVITLFFLSLVVVGIVSDPTSAAGIFYTRPEILAFVAGIWLSVWTANRDEGHHTVASATALAAGLMSFILITIYYEQIGKLFITDMWIILSCVCIIWAAVEFERYIVAFVPRWFVILGDASYSIYLFHMFAIGLVYRLGHAFIQTPFSGVLILCAFLSGIFAGLAAYWLLEKPMLRYVSSFWSRSKLKS